jgi:hypothetical protein
MEQLFDFTLVENFNEDHDYYKNLEGHAQEGFVVMPYTNFGTHLNAMGFENYNSIPRSVNEYNFLSSLKNNMNESGKAQIVCIHNSLYSGSAWVFMTVFNAKKNNYYALTFKVNEDMSGIHLKMKDVFEKTMKKGILCTVYRYKFLKESNVSKL